MELKCNIALSRDRPRVKNWLSFNPLGFLRKNAPSESSQYSITMLFLNEPSKHSDAKSLTTCSCCAFWSKVTSAFMDLVETKNLNSLMATISLVRLFFPWKKKEWHRIMTDFA